MEKDQNDEQLQRSVKQASLLTAQNKFPFALNPVINGEDPDKTIRGFWKMAGNKILRVEAREWDKNPLPLRGGTLVLGLSGEHSAHDMELIEAYVPDMIHEALGEALGTNVGWTIGSFGYGRYVAPGGTTFDERSTTIHIAGVSSEQLANAASLIGEQFNQSAVLVYDNNENTQYLLTAK